MINSNFKTGDLVKLKSGGPIMTICTKYDCADGLYTQDIRCVWWDVNENYFHDEHFPEDALMMEVK
jgi:uncharacterized protein YodC (DUF2158 family)